jgi:acyl-CoA reductase-like NAD-dependent aldehyde dehydrogenase
MFTWDEKPSAFKRAPERRREMYRREVAERAALLMRLGHKAAAVKTRLARTVAWDFDLQASPEHAGEVDAIVDDVYKRNQK